MLHVGFPGTQILRQSQNKHAGYFKPRPWNQNLLIGKGICGFRQRKESIKNAVSKSSPYHMERAGARPALQNYLMLNQVSILPHWSSLNPHCLEKRHDFGWGGCLEQKQSLKGLEAGATSSSLKGDLGGPSQCLLQGPYITLFLVLGLWISIIPPKETYAVPHLFLHKHPTSDWVNSFLLQFTNILIHISSRQPFAGSCSTSLPSRPFLFLVHHPCLCVSFFINIMPRATLPVKVQSRSYLEHISGAEQVFLQSFESCVWRRIPMNNQGKGRGVNMNISKEKY